MTHAYVDTSCVVAIAFSEPGSTKLAVQLTRLQSLFASNLLEAELRSALRREGISADPEPLLSRITWVYPDRPLTREFERIGAKGDVRGADLWHLACALFLAPSAKDLAFVTLDRRQQDVARKLGFRSAGR